MKIRQLKGSALPAILAPFIRNRMPPLDDNQTYAVLFFPMDERGVVFSGAALHALKRLGSKFPKPNPIVALGGCFTAEARAALEATGATILAHSTFHWTDESYQNVHQRLSGK